MDRRVHSRIQADAKEAGVFLDMRYLSSEELLAIHERILMEVGGRKGIRDIKLLQSVAERPKMGIMGLEFYPDIFFKAAAYTEGLATYHVFTDGNKRTAITATAIFLRANGYSLKMSQKEGYDLILAVAQKQKTVKDTARWLKKHSKKVAE